MDFARKLRVGTSSIIFIIVFMAVLVMVNLISLRFFTRFDLTEEKEFTVSDATQNMLSTLDDIIMIEVYFSGNLPSYTVPMVRRVKDMLEEYRAYSGDNLQITYLDPKGKGNEEIAEKARSLGVPEIQMNIIQKDQAQVANVYMGLAVFYEDRRSVLPVLTDVGNLEYELTTAIRAVLQEEISTVAFLAGNEEKDIDDNYLQIRRYLEKRYRVWPLNLKRGLPVPKKVQTLVVGGSRGMSDREKFEIDQFIMRGGKVVFMLDTIDITKSLGVKNIETNLGDMLTHYGARVRQDLVLDAQCSFASFSQGYVSYSLKYPFWPEIGRSGFSQDHPATMKLDAMVLPWVSSVAVDTGNQQGVTAETLVSSSEHSWTAKGKINLAPQQPYKPPDDTGPQSLAVRLSGTFKSFFEGKEIPAVEGVETKEGEEQQATDREIVTNSESAHIVIVGDSDFLTDSFVGQFPKNAIFFLNLIDWLSLNEGLIAIRSRGVKDRSIKKDIPVKQRNWAKSAGTLLMPVFLWIIGLLNYWFRRREQTSL